MVGAPSSTAGALDKLGTSAWHLKSFTQQKLLVFFCHLIFGESTMKPTIVSFQSKMAHIGIGYSSLGPLLYMYSS